MSRLDSLVDKAIAEMRRHMDFAGRLEEEHRTFLALQNAPYFMNSSSGSVYFGGWGLDEVYHSYWGKIGDSVPPGDGITVVRWDGE